MTVPETGARKTADAAPGLKPGTATTAADGERRGRLYVVATPIGNLEDITARARRILSEVDLIAAEDTRHSARLLNALGIDTPRVSLHEFNEASRAPGLVRRMRNGASIALISDAGTPLISDPGFRLIQLAGRAGIEVAPVPGACALVAALSAGGIPGDRFSFEGFLPPARGRRRDRLAELSREQRTLVFYESPRRVLDTVRDLAELFGARRRAALCRELTKRFETIETASLGDLVEWLDADPNRTRGEFVLVVSGAAPRAAKHSCRPEWVQAVRELRAYLPLKRAARIIADVTGASAQALYRDASERDAGKHGPPR